MMAEWGFDFTTAQLATGRAIRHALGEPRTERAEA
jgi:hypothetical protein